MNVQDFATMAADSKEKIHIVQQSGEQAYRLALPEQNVIMNERNELTNKYFMFKQTVAINQAKVYFSDDDIKISLFDIHKNIHRTMDYLGRMKYIVSVERGGFEDIPYVSFMDATLDSLQNIRDTKGKEYHGSQDTLMNFKRNANRLGLENETILMVYLNKHIDSINSFVANYEKGMSINDIPQSEPIEGRFDDAINYYLLLRGLLFDRGTK